MIRQASFVGCRAIDNQLPIYAMGHTVLPVGQPGIRIYHGLSQSWSPTLPSILQGKVKPGTDVIQIDRWGPDLAVLNQNMSNDYELIVSQELLIKAHDYLMIADCQYADYFQVATVQKQGNTLRLKSMTPLAHQYSQYASLAKLNTHIFYIRESSQNTEPAAVSYDLYWSDGHYQHEAWVPEIEALFIEQYQSPASEITSGKVQDRQNTWIKVTLKGGQLQQKASQQWQILIYVQ